jgi:Xaa-Pro dipeptidase
LNLRRKKFIQLSSLLAGGFLTSGFKSVRYSANSNGMGTAQAIVPDILSISPDERRARVAKAQSLMQQNNIRALVLESGTSLEYFTGISWWPSERTMVAVIPARGDILYICPGFEEARFQELITIGNKIYTWQEDESPFLQIVRAFYDTGIKSGKIGIEEELRFFISDGIRQAAPGLEYVSGDPVTIPCRMFKSVAELALMQKASDITVAAMKKGMSHLKEGVSQSDISAIVNEAHRQMGAIPDFALVLFGEASALPHGSIRSGPLKKGDIVLMDCGCRVEGYCSDISRTIVFGAEPTKRQLDIWNLEQKAQAAGFIAARSGNTCEQVDAAARKVITDAGFGPGYKLPGLPHRTGHGIGMDGHEWGNMVKGNQQPLQEGMCFSIEPTIAIPGEFGIRLEDCVYMTSEGPKWFSQPAISINKPFEGMPDL